MQDRDRVFQLVWEEIQDIYRDRHDTSVKAGKPSSVLLSRSGRDILVEIFLLDSGIVHFRIGRPFKSLDGEKLKNYLFYSLVAMAGLLVWRYYLGDPDTSNFARYMAHFSGSFKAWIAGFSHNDL